MRHGKKIGSYNNTGKIRNRVLKDFFDILEGHYKDISTEEHKKTKIYKALNDLLENKPSDYIKIFSGLIRQDALIEINDKEDIKKAVTRTVKYVD